MKVKSTIGAIIFGGMMLVNLDAFAQEPTDSSKKNQASIDSVALSFKNDQLKTQETRDKENMATLKEEKSDADTKAKEARRVEDNANYSAKQAKSAYKTERKAQKARKAANKQAAKAAKAKEKTN